MRTPASHPDTVAARRARSDCSPSATITAAAIDPTSGTIPHESCISNTHDFRSEDAEGVSRYSNHYSHSDAPTTSTVSIAEAPTNMAQEISQNALHQCRLPLTPSASKPQSPESSRPQSPRSMRRRRNREAAARMRSRQKQQLVTLEDRKEMLEQRAAELEEELRALQRQSDPYKNQILCLHELVDCIAETERSMLREIDQCQLCIQKLSGAISNFCVK
ncbi:hypothetical protein H4R22_001043 [Coemansia sp. RSA 1290]|nr:hypothetical protein H4R22_001043 [Coemansia sp. RSA 1290]KAJ2647424.1 hypothetical protein IWW40_004694 [Coemansia sp. RSA 1250]